MAKSVTEAVRHRAAQANGQTMARTDIVGRVGRGFKKTYSPEEWDLIEAERSAMRERLLAGE